MVRSSGASGGIAGAFQSFCGHPGRPAAQGVAISVGGPFGRVPGDPVSGGVQRKTVMLHITDPSARQKRRVGVNLDDGIAIRRPPGQSGNDSPDALRAAQVAAAGKELRRYRAPCATRALLASGGTGAALSSTTVTTASGRAVLAHRTQATASCASPA